MRPLLIFYKNKLQRPQIYRHKKVFLQHGTETKQEKQIFDFFFFGRVFLCSLFFLQGFGSKFKLTKGAVSVDDWPLETSNNSWDSTSEIEFPLFDDAALPTPLSGGGTMP